MFLEAEANFSQATEMVELIKALYGIEARAKTVAEHDYLAVLAELRQQEFGRRGFGAAGLREQRQLVSSADRVRSATSCGSMAVPGSRIARRVASRK